MPCKYTRASDRRACERRDNPLPRPADDDLLSMYGSRPAYCIARELGHNEHTVRSWIIRARWRP